MTPICGRQVSRAKRKSTVGRVLSTALLLEEGGEALDVLFHDLLDLNR